MFEIRHHVVPLLAIFMVAPGLAEYLLMRRRPLALAPLARIIVGECEVLVPLRFHVVRNETTALNYRTSASAGVPIERLWPSGYTGLLVHKSHRWAVMWHAHGLLRFEVTAGFGTARIRARMLPVGTALIWPLAVVGGLIAENAFQLVAVVAAGLFANVALFAFGRDAMGRDAQKHLAFFAERLCELAVDHHFPWSE